MPSCVRMVLGPTLDLSFSLLELLLFTYLSFIIIYLYNYLVVPLFASWRFLWRDISSRFDCRD